MLEKIDLERIAMFIMIRADQQGTTLASEVRREVDAIQARKKLRPEQAEGPSHRWGDNPPSPDSRDTQPDPLQEALGLITFPTQSDSLSPLSLSDYSSFTSTAAPSSVLPSFSAIPTSRRSRSVVQPSAVGSTPESTIPTPVVAQAVVQELAENPLGGGPPKPEVINVDSPDNLEQPSLLQQTTEGQDPPLTAEQPHHGAPPVEDRPASPANNPLIEDISASTFLTDTQQPAEPASQVPIKLLTYGHQATSSIEAVSDVSSASNAQLRILLAQAVTETQSRWAQAQNQAWGLGTSVERAWKQCQEAAEPVFGSIPKVSENNRIEEMANLCTRLGREAEHWRVQYRNSTQEATTLLVDSFEAFRMADDRLKEVKPVVVAHKGVLDHWPMYCDQAYAQEQGARAHAHHLRVQLQWSTATERPPV